MTAYSSLMTPLLAQLPPRNEIRQTAQEVLARDHYELGHDLPDVQGKLLKTILQFLLDALRGLIDLLDSLPAVVRWIVVAVLTVIVIALIAHMVWTIVSLIRNPRLKKFDFNSKVTALVPQELEKQADQAEAVGDYISAVRLLFRASLLRIEQADKRPIRRGTTNRELLRRYQSTGLYAPLRHFVETIDAKWYGSERCTPEDCQECREDHAQVREVIERRRNAVSA